jgi:hypothetical protein
MKVRVLAAVAALALGTAISGGAAQAATYYLTVDGCSSACVSTPGGNVGSVTVTQDATLTGVLDFSVTLNTPGVVFNSAGNSGQHNALAFDLNGGALSLAGLQFVSATAPTDFSLNTAGGSDSPFGSFTDLVDYTGSAKQGSAPSTLSFQLQDTAQNLTLAMLGFNPYTPQGSKTAEDIAFAADVAVNVGDKKYNTGNVGALDQPTGGVPEPATWGLMITGVFAIGAAMRMQRRRGLTLA